MKIYLAGPFESYKDYKDWRDFIKESAPQHNYHDPRYDSDQYSALTFTKDDLIEGVELSDLVFVYYPKSSFEVMGFSIEAGDAFGSRIPIIYTDENPFIYPMLSAIARRTFTDLKWAAKYLSYLDSMEKEFEAIYKIAKEIRGSASK